MQGPHAEPEPFVDMRAAAEFLGKDRRWLYNNQARQDIPRYKVGNHFRYRLSELDNWMKGRIVR